MSAGTNHDGEMPRVKRVSAGKRPWTVDVQWKDGSESHVDLTGLIHRSRHFRRFLEEPLAFRKVKIVDWGAAIGWENGLDYSANTLKTIAEEQRPLSGADLQAFEAKNNLNSAETANLFDVSERTIREYRTVEKLPQPIALALRAMLANSAVLDAHYRPAARRPRGRPKQSVSR
jgi:DNA-binding transcriptional regulator YiaG